MQRTRVHKDGAAVHIRGNAMGRNAGGSGGSIEGLADGSASGAEQRLNASGDSGGGIARVGGDFHGQGR